MNTIPYGLARAVVELHGAEGVEWLDHVRFTIADCAERWGLTLMPPFEPLWYNYVAPVIRADGTDAVLKAGVPSAELRTEVEALRLFGGHGIVQLLEADPDRGVLLLERLRPGTPLSSLSDDEQATSAAIRVMRHMRRPVPSGHSFPMVGTWASGLERMRERFDGTGPFPGRLVETAERLFTELISSMAEPVLLHGDLHHQNILASERHPWLAVDPKGVVGEPEYEVGALLRNPMPQLLAESQPRRLLSRRVDQLAEELGFDRERLLGWSAAQAVLAAWWSYEDHGHGWEPWIECAEILVALAQRAA